MSIEFALLSALLPDVHACAWLSTKRRDSGMGATACVFAPCAKRGERVVIETRTRLDYRANWGGCSRKSFRTEGNSPMREMSAVMTVVIRDPSNEKTDGPPCIRIVTVSAFCRICLMPRGIPRPVIVTDGYRPYWLDVWHNACGHPDKWESILEEAAAQCVRPDCVLSASDTWYPYCSKQCSVHNHADLEWWRVLKSYLHRSLIQVPAEMAAP